MDLFRRDSEPDSDPNPERFRDLMVDGQPAFEDLLACVFDVTESDAEVLRHLLAADGGTVEELARELGCNRSTVNRRLDTLRERSLVTRRRTLLRGGGIAYVYEPLPPDRIAERMHRSLEEWTAFMHEEIDDRVDAIAEQ